MKNVLMFFGQNCPPKNLFKKYNIPTQEVTLSTKIFLYDLIIFDNRISNFN